MKAIAEVEGTGHAVFILDPKRIKPFPDNPRKKFRRIPQLAQSIKRAGQRQPIEVFPDNSDSDFDFLLVDGERRLRACILGEMKVRAIVTEKLDLNEQFVRSVAANFGREDHDVLETSDMLAKLETMGLTQMEMAEICGKSQGWVSQHLLLQKLHESVRVLLVPSEDEDDFRNEEGRKLRRKAPLSFQIAMLLVPFAHEEQNKLVKKIHGKSFADARRIVLAASDAAGIVRRERNTPHQRLNALDKAVATLNTALAPYLDMRESEFVAAFAKADREFVRRLSAVMQECGMQLVQSGKQLQKIVDNPLRALKA